jgi:glucokinase
VTRTVGIDVGGTKIAGAVVDVADGSILSARRIATDAARGPAAVLADCVSLAGELGPVAAIGMAVCELVDPSGAVRSAETVDWRGVDVAGAFTSIAPARVESDVRAAALAEGRFGAGRGCDDFVYVSVGTGISHCLVVDGRPRLGAHGSAVVTGAPPVEQWSSGLAFAQGRSVEDGATLLGVALAALVNALDPGLLIVGGGLGLDDAYRERFVAAMRAAVYDPAVRELPVRAAALGADAGVIGAALAAVHAGAE